MWIIICIFTTLVLILMYISPWERQQRRYWAIVRRTREMFAGRPNLTPKEFAESYFPEKQKEIANNVANILEKLGFLEQDIVSRMNPSDRLIDDIGVNMADGLEMAELVAAIEKEFEITIDEWAEEVITIGQLVNYIEHKKNIL